MKRINIVYADEYDDVDILCVPDFVHDNIEAVTQNFFDWTSSTKEDGYFTQNPQGDEVLCVGTEEFIKWLNDNYIQYENQKATVIEAHTIYNPNYPSAEF